MKLLKLLITYYLLINAMKIIHVLLIYHVTQIDNYQVCPPPPIFLKNSKPDRSTISTRKLDSSNRNA